MAREKVGQRAAAVRGDGEGQCFVSDLPAEQVVTNLAAVGIPAEVVEH